MRELNTYTKNTWCPGCGNFGILNSFKKAVKVLSEQGTHESSIMMVHGIGCHGKASSYLNLSGVYSLHGRSMAVAEGIKLANPELNVINFAGDGDAYGEGLSHFLFAAKRNSDITLIVHNNGVYGLTTGQFTPTSVKGQKGPSSPYGNPEDPFNPLTLALEAGATFVARGYPGKPAHLTELIVKAVMHEGFSIIDILQPCVTFNNTYSLYNEKTYIMGKIPSGYEEAFSEVKRTDRIALGVFFEAVKTPYHIMMRESSSGKGRPVSKKDRLEIIKRDYLED